MRSAGAGPSASGAGGAGGDRKIDIFFTLRLHDSRHRNPKEPVEAARRLKELIERQRPEVRCFVSGDNPNGANIAEIIAAAFDEARLIVIMGSEMYGENTGGAFTTSKELQLAFDEHKALFVVKMCERYEVATTRMKLGNDIKFVKWDEASVDALAVQILQKFDAVSQCASERI